MKRLHRITLYGVLLCTPPWSMRMKHQSSVRILCITALGMLLASFFALWGSTGAAHAHATSETINLTSASGRCGTALPYQAAATLELSGYASSVRPLHTTASCDREYALHSKQCRRIKHPASRALCWAAAAAAYATCLATATPPPGNGGGGGGGWSSPPSNRSGALET